MAERGARGGRARGSPRGSLRGNRGGRGNRGAPRGAGMAKGPPRGGGWMTGASSGNIQRNKKPDFAGNARLATIFKEFDEDNSGFISPVELRVSLKKKFDLDLDHDNTMLLLQHCDDNADGELSEEEFCKIIELVLDMKKQFENADVDGSRAIDCNELQILMQKMSVNVPSELTTKLMQIFDDDDSGEIEFQEFFNLILYVQELEYQYTKRYKKSRSGPSDFVWVKKLLGASAADPELISTLERIKNISFSNFIEEVINALARNKRMKAPRAQKVRPPRKKAPKRTIHTKRSKVARVLSRQMKVGINYSRDNPFVDHDFPGNSSSLGRLASKVASWKRPHEINPNPRLFVDGVEEGDVVQGALGNCWFLGALSVIACSGNEFIEDSFVESNLDIGRHLCRFFKDGHWVEVEVDDLIPCNSMGKPAFASCRDSNEFWVPIIEKAYAKLHGGYETLQSGLLSYALKDITGEAVESLHLDKKDTLPCGGGDVDIWKMFVENIQESFIMGCSIVSPVAMPEEKNDFDLLLNHAYGIIDCQEVQGHKLIRLRNPWGNYEWNGRWSDDSPEWTPELQKHFGNYGFDNDGTFFMCFEDFLLFFNSVHVLRLLTDDVGEIWEKHSFEGKWDTESAGGCLTNQSWVKNPQYRIYSSLPNTRVFVCLSQADKRFHDHKNSKLESAGLTILKGDFRTRQKTKKTACKQGDLVKNSIFYSSRDIAVEFQLPEAGANNDFVIIPSFYQPGITSEYSLMIYMQHPGVIEELTARKQQESNVDTTRRISGFHRQAAGPSNVASSSWGNGTSGGCMNHSTWITNPQFIVKFSEPGAATISITQTLVENQPPVTMGAYIFDASHMFGYRLGDQTQKFAAKLSFINLENVSGVLTIEDPSVPYMIMPCTFDSGVHREFTVEVTPSAGRAIVKPAKEWSDSTKIGEWITGRAGGSMNHRSWANNQTFRLSISGSEPCNFPLAMFVPELVESKIGFYIFEDVNNNGNPVIQGLRGNCPFKGTYSNIFKFVDWPAKRYIILPCTEKPKNNSKFFLAALSPRCTLEGPFV